MRLWKRDNLGDQFFVKACGNTLAFVWADVAGMRNIMDHDH